MAKKCNSAPYNEREKKMRLIEDRRKNEYKNNNFHVFIRITQTIYIVSTGKEEKLN